MSLRNPQFRSAARRVRGLGAAHTGTGHFIGSRVTSVASVPLTIAFIAIVIALLGRNHAATVQILGSPLVAILMILFGYTWALLHHGLGGVRHLIWDMGRGFEPTEREMLTLATLIGSIGLTIVVWVVGYFALGGLR